jgi:hypothetical protein
MKMKKLLLFVAHAFYVTRAIRTGELYYEQTNQVIYSKRSKLSRTAIPLRPHGRLAEQNKQRLLQGGSFGHIQGYG